MDQAKLATAAERCLTAALSTDKPFRQVADCIDTLKADPEWTDAEIVEVQTHVIRQLMERMGMAG